MCVLLFNIWKQNVYVILHLFHYIYLIIYIIVLWFYFSPVFPAGVSFLMVLVSSLLVCLSCWCVFPAGVDATGGILQPDTQTGDTRGSSVRRRSRVRIEVSG